MRRNIAGVVEGWQRAGHLHVAAVFTGKVKPVILQFPQVLEEGLLATREDDATPTVFPFTGMTSIAPYDDPEGE